MRSTQARINALLIMQQAPRHESIKKLEVCLHQLCGYFCQLSGKVVTASGIVVINYGYAILRGTCTHPNACKFLGERTSANVEGIWIFAS
jgi:hypothetical protein